MLQFLNDRTPWRLCHMQMAVLAHGIPVCGSISPLVIASLGCLLPPGLPVSYCFGVLLCWISRAVGSPRATCTLSTCLCWQSHCVFIEFWMIRHFGCFPGLVKKIGSGKETWFGKFHRIQLMLGAPRVALEKQFPLTPTHPEAEQVTGIGGRPPEEREVSTGAITTPLNQSPHGSPMHTICSDKSSTISANVNGRPRTNCEPWLFDGRPAQ